MHRVTAFILFATATAIAVPVLADSKADAKYAGRKGYVSAYDSNMSTVLDVQSCDMKNRAHDYVECGKHLRERVKDDLCRNRGKGSHEFYYQVGDGKKLKNSAYCK